MVCSSNLIITHFLINPILMGSCLFSTIQTALLLALYISFTSSLLKLQEAMAAQIRGLKSMNKLSAASRRLPMLVEKLPVKYGRSGPKKSKREGDENGLRKMEGRKSVSCVETNLISVASFLQVKVLACDMPEFVQIHAFRCARITFDSLEKFSGKHMAYNIKKEFDKVYGPAWHCIVGSNFGSFVTHSTGCFIYFSMEKLYLLLFKTQIQKAVEYI